MGGKKTCLIIRHKSYSGFWRTKRRFVAATACFQMIEDLKDQTVGFVPRAKNSYGWILSLSVSGIIKAGIITGIFPIQKRKENVGQEQIQVFYCNYIRRKELSGAVFNMIENERTRCNRRQRIGEIQIWFWNLILRGLEKFIHSLIYWLTQNTFNEHLLLSDSVLVNISKEEFTFYIACHANQ